MDGPSHEDSPGIPPTDAERERFAGLLRDAVGAGILSLEEFESRLTAVYSADSLDKLEALVRWVPVPSSAPARSVPSKRRLVAVGASAAALLAVLTLVVVLTQGPSGTRVPLVTGVSPAASIGSEHNIVHVTWPAGTRSGIVETFGGGTSTAPVPAVADYSLYAFPVSYRAVACFTACDPTSPSPDMIVGPWYRPNVGSELAGPAPVLQVARQPGGRGYGLTVHLGTHTGAPMVFLFRDGVVVGSVSNSDHSAGIVTWPDPGVASGPSISYSAAACYADCYPAAVTAEFAELTGRSAPVVEPSMTLNGIG